MVSTSPTHTHTHKPSFLNHSLFCTTRNDTNDDAETVLIEILDGRHLIGTLRSFDQYGNMVLESARERHYIENQFADVPLGLYIVRGENVVLLGEIDLEREKQIQAQGILKKISEEEYLKLKASLPPAQTKSKRANNVET